MNQLETSSPYFKANQDSALPRQRGQATRRSTAQRQQLRRGPACDLGPASSTTGPAPARDLALQARRQSLSPQRGCARWWLQRRRLPGDASAGVSPRSPLPPGRAPSLISCDWAPSAQHPRGVGPLRCHSRAPAPRGPPTPRVPLCGPHSPIPFHPHRSSGH